MALIVGVLPARASDCIGDDCADGGNVYETDENYIDDSELLNLYNETMTDAELTRERIEGLLSPKRPGHNLWTDDAPRHSETIHGVNVHTSIVIPNYKINEWHAEIVADAHRAAIFDGCPFDTEPECEIWHSKPVVHETIVPRRFPIYNNQMADIITTLRLTDTLDANSPVAEPLLARYRELMRLSNTCCTDGIIYSLRRAGAEEGLVYKFLVDDANFYGVAERCLMMTDEDLDANFPKEPSTAATISDVRNRCLCRDRQRYAKLLEPFVDAWNTSEKFAASPFMWKHIDGLNREVPVAINYDVQNVLNQLSQCP